MFNLKCFVWICQTFLGMRVNSWSELGHVTAASFGIGGLKNVKVDAYSKIHNLLEQIRYLPLILNIACRASSLSLGDTSIR